MARIGFIGLGDMGQVIIPRLLAAGHAVTGWNRTIGKEGALVDAGMSVAATPADATRDADVVFSIVTDAAAVRSVALGDDGILAALGEDAVYVDMSTISPDASREVSTAFAHAGRVMLDAPVSGSPVTVRNGQASVMVGGDPDAFEKVRPVLLDIGPKVTFIGGPGLAVQAKLSVNLLLMAEVIAFGEAVALAEKGGVPREAIVGAILNSVAASPVLGYRGPFVLEGNMPEKPLADVTLQQKDMTLVLEQGRLLGMPLPMASSANEMMNACRGMGIDKNDFVIAHEAYRRMGGLSR
ncbi:MAG: NAD(P)-dependent oxidoreductase [Actinomycetota bacterium]|nr:NAD(P)-dependent oxidoreductase [Actinomycetota bacterium]